MQCLSHILYSFRAPLNSLVYECCTQLNNTLRTNLFFLKTHKTGTTTLQNIILRFAEKHNLSIMWPFPHTYYLPISPEILKPEYKTVDNKYNIMAFHLRYTPELKSYQNPDSLMISILRHPAILFQSAYTFFEMEKTTRMTFEEFLRAPSKPANLGGRNSETAYRGYNQLSVDLGFDPQDAANKTAVQEFIEKIDEEFDFMMITEFMDASLVLLANLMGWPLEYVAYLPLNVRGSLEGTYVQTEQDKLHVMELNNVDTALYNHFLNKFHKCVQQYGEAQLEKQVDTLREINRELHEKCIMIEHRFGFLNTVNYILKNYTDAECVAAAKVYY